MTGTDQLMKLWAQINPQKIFGKPIGEHTWVASDDGCCVSCMFGVRLKPDQKYCDATRWKTGVYVPPAKSRTLASAQDSANRAKCMAGKPGNFMCIPSQGGIVYAINGVCHNLANRILYPTKATAEGADGYVFTKFLFGVYGTQVPFSHIPFFLPGTLTPNPLYAVAAAFSIAVSVEWFNLRKKCKSKTMEAAENNDRTDYLGRVQKLHDRPIISEERDGLSAADHFDLLERSYERHMQEIDLTLEHHGHGIGAGKIGELRALWSDFHRPSQDSVDAFYEHRSADSGPQSDVKLSEHDWIILAHEMNTRIGELSGRIADLLGPDDFRTIYGHAPEEPSLVVNPMILKGTATEDPA